MENVLLSSEIEMYIETMKCTNIEDIGSESWINWHRRILKLNQQATLEASEMREETVKEVLVTCNKINILIHEIICISVWKENIFPYIIQFDPDPSNTFAIYSVLYHEANCIALLEAVMFHSNSCETLDESALDLLDYCCEMVMNTLNYKKSKPETNEPFLTEIQRQRKDLEFDIGIRSISILRYFSEYLEYLPLSIASRMFKTHDVPLLFVQLVIAKPWSQADDKGELKYIGSKWQKVEDKTKLIQPEAQVWIGLRQLLLNPNFFTHYNLSEFRRNQLSKLLKYLQDDILDQLSPLIDLKQSLCQLTFNQEPTATSTKTFLIEVVPEIKQSLISQIRGKCKQIAKKQAELLFRNNHNDIIEMASSLSDAYNIDVFEKLENIKLNTCHCCGGNATKKCSICKQVWYCSRNCQVKNWSEHKEECEQLLKI